MKDWFKDFYTNHRIACWGAILGLLVAVLLLTLNFWRTLLIALLAGAGYYIGGLKDKGYSITQMIYKIYNRFKKK